jgi:hypothetical protein
MPPPEIRMPAAERRAHPRSRPAPQASCQVTLPGGTAVPAVVQDLAARGLLLRLAQSVPPGTALVVRLVNGAGVYSLAVRLYVTRSEAQADGSHLVAGELERTLSPRELGPFVAGHVGPRGEPARTASGVCG